MSCHSPVPYRVGEFNSSTGKFKNIVLPRTPDNLASTSLRFPCGGCLGCRIDSSRQKAIRIEHEVQTQSESGRGSCFITLTYATEHMPTLGNTGVGTLNKSHWPAFLKRLRRRITDPSDRFFVSTDLRIKQVYCGEYGDNGTHRPHFHGIIFGYDFPDRKYFDERRGNILYRSEFLEELWPFGHSTIGTATWQSGAYVARYVMKKVTGERAKEHYQVIDSSTGEVFDRVPEYNVIGNGIGLDWFNKYGVPDVYPAGQVITKAGKRMKPPRYYDSKYELLDPDDMYRLKQDRMAAIKRMASDNTEDRLAVKSKILRTRVGRLKRDIL